MHTDTHTQIHICLLRSPLPSFIFYSKALWRSERIGQSSVSDEQESKPVCVFMTVGGGGWQRGICVLIFSFFLLSVCHQQGGSLIMFLVVFTNVSFIKLQHPQGRHHPSSKVEVIITLNHLAGYLFAWLSWADGGQPQLAPEGKSCHSAPPLFLSLCHSYFLILLFTIHS